MVSINSNSFTPKYNSVSFQSKHEKPEKQNRPSYFNDEFDEYITSGEPKKKYTSFLARLCEAVDLIYVADQLQEKADNKKIAIERAKNIKRIKQNHENFNEMIAEPRPMNELYDDFIGAIFKPVGKTRAHVAQMEKEHGKLQYNIKCKTDHLSAGGVNYNLLVFGDGTVHKTPNYIASRQDCWDPECLPDYIDFPTEEKRISEKEYNKILNALEGVHGKVKTSKSVYNEEKGGLVRVLRFGDYHEIEMPSVKFEKPDTEPVVAEDIDSKTAEEYLKHKNLYGGVKSISKHSEKCSRDIDTYIDIEYNDGSKKTHYLH